MYSFILIQESIINSRFLVRVYKFNNRNDLFTINIEIAILDDGDIACKTFHYFSEEVSDKEILRIKKELNISK